MDSGAALIAMGCYSTVAYLVSFFQLVQVAVQLVLSAPSRKHDSWTVPSGVSLYSKRLIKVWAL